MKNRVFFLGDIHGTFKTIRRNIKRLKIGKEKTITYIIQVGDFGIGFNPYTDNDTLLSLNRFCKKRNIIMLSIRGNHDDPSFFKGNHIYSNLQLLEDYTIKTINDENYLFIGGAVSIDRKYRLRKDQLNASDGRTNRSYWFDEIFVYDREIVNNIFNINVLVTHTAPDWCAIDNRNGFGDFVNDFAYNDKELYTDLTTERENVTLMFRHLERNGCNIHSHYYGHFHRSEITMNGYTNHYLLNINEFREL